jgi:hypothetical protein
VAGGVDAQPVDRSANTVGGQQGLHGAGFDAGGNRFVWHPRLPGWLAWIDDSAGAPALTIAQFIPGRVANPQLVGEVSPETTVVWWNDLGIVTVEWIEAGAAGGQLQLRGNAGEVTHSIEIDYVLGTGRQVIAVQIDGDQVLLDQQLNVVAGVPWAARLQPGRVRAARFQRPRDVWRLQHSASRTLARHRRRLRAECSSSQQRPTPVSASRTDGVPYAFRVDPVRSATTIEFYIPIQGEVYEVAYPGRAMWIELVRG